MDELFSDKEKKEVELILKYYKKAYHCKKCGDIFGSDLIKEDKICPNCLKKIVNVRKR